MFEKEIEFIYKYNLNKIKQLGSFITYEQLVSTNLHPALLQYLSAEIDFLIFEDRQKLLKDSLFDYSGDKIIDHFLNIGEEIKRTKKFSYEYLSKLLLHASSFNANFIIRPKWSLLQFIFENEDETEKQIVEIKQILNYLHYYPYLKRLLISFFNKKRLITISSSDLKELLDKIDTINYETNFEKVLESALTTMAEFIYIGEIQNKKVSRQFVELFLADKGLSHLSIALNEKYGASSNEKIEIIELKKTILNFNSEDEILDEEEQNNPLDSTHELSNENSFVADDDESESIYEEENEEQDNQHDEQFNELSYPDNSDNSEKENFEVEEVSNKTDVQEEKKSFLESYIENVEKIEEVGEEENNDEQIPSNNELESDDEEELAPVDLDEATREDDEDIGELYELASEEEKLDSFLDDSDAYIDRIEINDEDGNPFEESNLDAESNEVEKNSASLDEGFITQGTSVTFKADELLAEKDEITEVPTQEVDNKEKDESWPTKSSNNLDEIIILEEEIDEVDKEIEEENNDNIEIKENENVIDNTELLDTEILDSNQKQKDSIEEIADNENQQTLFQDNDFDESEVDDVSLQAETDEEDNEPTRDAKHIDISLLLEDKKITKIIEVIFDYDMEEFANSIDLISECQNIDEANKVIDEIADKAYIDTSAKEIKVFKNIISNYLK